MAKSLPTPSGNKSNWGAKVKLIFLGLSLEGIYCKDEYGAFFHMTGSSLPLDQNNLDAEKDQDQGGVMGVLTSIKDFISDHLQVSLKRVSFAWLDVPVYFTESADTFFPAGKNSKLAPRTVYVSGGVEGVKIELQPPGDELIKLWSKESYKDENSQTAIIQHFEQSGIRLKTSDSTGVHALRHGEVLRGSSKDSKSDYALWENVMVLKIEIEVRGKSKEKKAVSNPEWPVLVGKAEEEHYSQWLLESAKQLSDDTKSEWRNSVWEKPEDDGTSPKEKWEINNKALKENAVTTIQPSMLGASFANIPKGIFTFQSFEFISSNDFSAAIRTKVTEDFRAENNGLQGHPSMKIPEVMEDGIPKPKLLSLDERILLGIREMGLGGKEPQAQPQP